MKKLTQKLVLSVITMALVVVALGTSTFAWFTLQNNATVQSFQGQVTAGEGIEVSLGTWTVGTPGSASVTAASEWYTVLPSEKIQQRIVEMYGGTLALPTFRFKDVTSQTGALVETKDLGDATGMYLALDLFFRSAETGKLINVNNVKIGGTSKVWNVDVPTFTGANGEPYGSAETDKFMQVAAWTAARVSIKHGTTYGTAGTLTVFERTAVPYTSVEPLTTTVFNSNSLSEYTPETSVGAGDAVIDNGAASYWVAKGNTTALTAGTVASTTLVPEDGTVASPVTVVSLTTPTTQPVAGTVYNYGNVVVQVWLEGWDADTFDALFATELTVQLGFIGA